MSYSGAKMDFGACLTGLESCCNHLLVGGKQVKAQFHPEKDIQAILPWISIVFPENIPGRGLRGFWELPTCCFQIQMKSWREKRPQTFGRTDLYFYLLSATLVVLSCSSLSNNLSKKWTFSYQLLITHLARV